MSKKGFSLLELMVVIIIIGILASLAYAGMNALIQTNRAKEAAREMTSFIERAIAEGKMRQDAVTISISGGTLTAEMTGKDAITKTLANGFSIEQANSLPEGCENYFEGNSIISENKIGISGVSVSGCFVVCNKSKYCGSAVKESTKNKFVAQIKKPSAAWEAL